MAKKSETDTEGLKEVIEETSAEEVEEQTGADEEGVSEIDQLNSTIDQLKKEAADYKEQFIRKHADFENFRKRMIRDKEDSIRYANASLLKDLISVIDDFERAIGSAEESEDFESFLSGIKLIERQFASMLENNWGLKRMETIGEEFDPQKHEALMMEENEGCSTETVIEDYQKGYVLHDRVLRHAKVKVGKPVEEADTDESTIQ